MNNTVRGVEKETPPSQTMHLKECEKNKRGKRRPPLRNKHKLDFVIGANFLIFQGHKR